MKSHRRGVSDSSSFVSSTNSPFNVSNNASDMATAAATANSTVIPTREAPPPSRKEKQELTVNPLLYENLGVYTNFQLSVVIISAYLSLLVVGLALYNHLGLQLFLLQQNPQLYHAPYQALNHHLQSSAISPPMSWNQNQDPTIRNHHERDYQASSERPGHSLVTRIEEPTPLSPPPPQQQMQQQQQQQLPYHVLSHAGSMPLVYGEKHFYRTHESAPSLLPPQVVFEPPPTVTCPDGVTQGYRDWQSLEDALHAANRFAATWYQDWNFYWSQLSPPSIDDPSLSTHNESNRTASHDIMSLAPEFWTVPQLHIPICNDVTLHATSPVTLQAPHVTVSCEGCIWKLKNRRGQYHLSFGSYARDVLLQGITFWGATASSLLLHQHGASVRVEDCLFLNNKAVGPQVGFVVDINSTSQINFFNCQMGDSPKTKTNTNSHLSIRM